MTPAAFSLPASGHEGEIRPISALPCGHGACPFPTILAARRYVSPRSRPLTEDEAETRRIAYALKTCDPQAIVIAASEMAGLLPPGLPALTLVPVPSSTGSTKANAELAQAIAHCYGPGARVVEALRRTLPSESSCQRRRHGMPGLEARDHKFERAGFWVKLPVFFVDNVVTSGATIAAAQWTLGFGSGLVFADAS